MRQTSLKGTDEKYPNESNIPRTDRLLETQTESLPYELMVRSAISFALAPCSAARLVPDLPDGRSDLASQGACGSLVRASQGGPMPTGNPRIVTLSPIPAKYLTARTPWLPKLFFLALDTAQKSGYFESKNSIRQRGLRDCPAWLCIGVLPCNCRQPLATRRRDELGVANSNVTSEVTDQTCPHTCAREGAPAESKNHRVHRVRPVRPLDEAVLTTRETPPHRTPARGHSKPEDMDAG